MSRREDLAPVDKTAYRIDRRKVPMLRCGLCDEIIEPGEPTTYVDDERVHRDCADEYAEQYGGAA